MKLGLTTNIFSEALWAGEVNLGGIVELAEEEGFGAIEVRDDDATLDTSELAGFVKDAAAAGIELSYAVNNDMSYRDDQALIERGIERACSCGEGTVLRFLASQSALTGEGKKGYSAQEVRRIVEALHSYAQAATQSDVSLALEHAREPLYGDGETFFGLHDIFVEIEHSGGVPDDLGITFDPANAISAGLCKAPATPAKVLEFLATHSQFIALVHLKTTRSGRVAPTIGDADIDNEALFESLAKVYKGVVCIEIPPAGDLLSCRRNIEASLDYLRSSGLMGYFAQKGRA